MSIFGTQAKPLDRVEAVVLTSPASGVRLNGLLRLPNGPGPFPAAVLLPERSTDDRNPDSADNPQLSSLADYLVSQGVVVVRLHARGRGGSEGSAAAITVAERTADAITALNYLRTRPQVEATRLASLATAKAATWPCWPGPSRWPPPLWWRWAPPACPAPNC